MKSKLLIIIVAVLLSAVLLLAGGGGAYYFLVLNKKESAEAKKKDHHEEEAEGEAHANTGEQASAQTDEEEAAAAEEEAAEEHGGGHGESSGPRIDPFVVNLADPGSRRYLRMNLNIALKKPKEDEPLLQARMPQLRDVVLLLLSSKTAAQLQGPEGKTALRQELIDQVNQVLAGKKKKKVVKNLYFTEFLIQ